MIRKLLSLGILLAFLSACAAREGLEDNGLGGTGSPVVAVAPTDAEPKLEP